MSPHSFPFCLLCQVTQEKAHFDKDQRLYVCCLLWLFPHPKTVVFSLLLKLDSEFNNICEGKGDLFIRRWDAIIIPHLIDVALKEKSEIAALVQGVTDLTDGMFSHILF